MYVRLSHVIKITYLLSYLLICGTQLLKLEFLFGTKIKAVPSCVTKGADVGQRHSKSSGSRTDG